MGLREDRKRVARKQAWEVQTIAEKFHCKPKDVRGVIDAMKEGKQSRELVEAAMKLAGFSEVQKEA